MNAHLAVLDAAFGELLTFDPARPNSAPRNG